MDDLRFPIGKFDRPTGPLTDAERAAAIDAIARTPANLRAAATGLNDAQLATPYRPGGWTVRQLVNHVADSHMNAYIRFKLALTEEVPAIKPYDEKAWSELAESRETSPEVSLTLLEALHDRWVRLLRGMQPADFQRKLRHPEWGEMPVEFFLALYAWHGPHHTAHITGLRKREGW